MTKKWTEEDIEFALNSAWNAFDSTLKMHGVSENQLGELSAVAVATGVYTNVRNLVHTIVGEEG